MIIENLNITIVVISGKSHTIKITPLLWLLVPSIKSWSNPSLTSEEIQVPVPKLNTDELSKLLFLYRKTAKSYSVMFLCFEVNIGGWQLNEVGKIYPKEWDYLKAKVSFQEMREKYNQLNATGYFA